MVTNRHQGYAGALAHESPHYCPLGLKLRAQIAFFCILAIAHLYSLATHHI